MVQVFGLMFMVVAISGVAAAKVPKNIILFVGDGLGPQQYTLAITYARQSPKSPYKKTGLNLEKLMRQGVNGHMLTYPEGALVVDSAASATQLATGHFSRSEMVGVDYLGHKRPTVVEMSKKLGKATGLVSNTRLTHATPAAFAAHVPHRSMENEIASQLVASGVDVMLSGGLQFFLPNSVNDQKSKAYQEYSKSLPKGFRLTSKRKDETDLLKKSRSKGYDVVFNLEKLNKSQSSKILGLFAASGMPNALEERVAEKNPKRVIPTLADMTGRSLQVLSKRKKGFFLMVEAGQIDWAGHNSDVGTMLNEVLQMDKAIGKAIDFQKKNPDTLIVVVSDHETGSFGFSYSRNNLPKPKKLQGELFHDYSFAPKYNFGRPDVLDRIFAQKMSFRSIIEEFDNLPKMKQTPKRLAAIVNEATEFTLSERDAQKVLKTEKNTFQVKGHKYLSKKSFPMIPSYKEYYVYGKHVRTNLIGQQLAAQQQVVWGTGTHTTTMVPIVAFGRGSDQFKGLMHSTEVGQLLFRLSGLKWQSKPTGKRTQN